MLSHTITLSIWQKLVLRILVRLRSWLQMLLNNCASCIVEVLAVFCVKIQVRDLQYNSSHLYPNCIITHMLVKWTNHVPGIFRCGVRMALTGLAIRKYVSSGLASCLCTILCISITFCCSLFISYHWISLSISFCISAWVCCIASHMNSHMYVGQQVSGLGSGFPISQLLMIQPHILVLPQ